MSAWDHKGRHTRDEDEGTVSDPSRSVLERWHLLNIMHAPGMTDSFYQILGRIGEVCPPGNELRKGRKRLAEDAGISLRTVAEFFRWAYATGVMERQRGKRGFSDRVWPNYAAWLDYAAKTVQRMSDPERRAKEADRLAAFGIALRKDESWGRTFRASMGSEPIASPSEATSLPSEAASPGVVKQTTLPPVKQLHTRTESLTGLSDRRGKQVRENGPEPAPLRASPSSSPSGGLEDERPKNTTRQKEQEQVTRVVEHLSKLERKEWDRHIEILQRQGYPASVLEEAKRTALGSVNGKGKAGELEDRPLLGAKRRLQKKGLDVRKAR